MNIWKSGNQHFHQLMLSSKNIVVFHQTQKSRSVIHQIHSPELLSPVDIPNTDGHCAGRNVSINTAPSLGHQASKKKAACSPETLEWLCFEIIQYSFNSVWNGFMHTDLK